jgi:hypothetical protein
MRSADHDDDDRDNNDPRDAAMACPLCEPFHQPHVIDCRSEECLVEVAISDFGDLGKRVILVGRLDILGAAKIVEPLANIADAHSIIVDMSSVDFIGSTGMHQLLLAAKTVARN